MNHLYTPQVEPVRHYSEPLTPVAHKRYVSKSAFPTKARLSQFAQYMEDFRLPERYQLSKLNTLTSWKDDVYRACFRHRDFSRHMTRSFLDVCDKRNYSEALLMVQAANDRLLSSGHSAAMSDDEIVQFAAAKARQFKIEISKLTTEQEQFYKACECLDSIGLEFSEQTIKQKAWAGELFSLVNRVCDEIYLRRQLRRKYAYEVEQVARDLALVQRHKQVYCSDFSVMRQSERATANRSALENTVAFDASDLDNWFTIAELSDKSISNPELRRGEMFVRLRGFEEIAQENGHAAVFLTSTCPSRFHPISNGRVNSKWVQAGRPDARQGHAHLIGVWQALGKFMANQKNQSLWVAHCRATSGRYAAPSLLVIHVE
ncbi:replication endonuclease [Vibrio olivae]